MEYKKPNDKGKGETSTYSKDITSKVVSGVHNTTERNFVRTEEDLREVL